jgi:hypothetical protein
VSSPSLSPSPADRARYWLVDEWDQADATIAKLADCGLAIARAARAQLEAAGIIPARADDAYRPPDLPRMPAELRAGLCASGEHDPDLWTSSSHAERAQAKAICATCPALEACRDWSLSLSVWDTSAIWGGLGAKARIKLKRDRQVYAPGAPQAGPRARCGSCSRALEGSNLIMITPAGKPPYRGCAWCRRKAARESARRRRGRERAQAMPSS